MPVTLVSTTDSDAEVRAALGADAPPEPDAVSEPPAAPEETPAASAPAADDETEETPSDPEDEQQPESRKRAKNRYDRLVKRLNDKDREIAALRAQHETLERLMRPEREASASPPAPPDPAVRPQPEQYDSHEAYTEALVARALAERDRQEAAAREQAAQAERQRVWMSHAERMREQHDDFDEVWQRIMPLVAGDLALDNALGRNPRGAELGYWLAKEHMDEFQRLKGLPVMDAAEELGALRERILRTADPTTSPATTPPAARPVAPPKPAPLEPVSGMTTGQSSVPMDQMEYQDFKRLRREQGAR
jgi:hypothetical protein